jgi:hypothetical protein
MTRMIRPSLLRWAVQVQGSFPLPVLALVIESWREQI